MQWISGRLRSSFSSPVKNAFRSVSFDSTSLLAHVCITMGAFFVDKNGEIFEVIMDATRSPLDRGALRQWFYSARE